MNTLTDRYLHDVLGRLPESRRQEVGRELRARIADTIAARVQTGSSLAQAEMDAISSLGHPMRLAQTYDQRPQFLIGPRWFPQYISILKTVGVTVVVVIAMLTMALATVDGESAITIVKQGFKTALMVASQFLLWTTLIFAILERVPGADADLDTWSIDDLPEAEPAKRIGILETLGTIVTYVVLAVVVIVQAISGIGTFIWGQDDKPWINEPAINPDLPNAVKVGFFALIALSIGLALIRHIIGRWTMTAVATVIVDSVAWIVFAAFVANRYAIANPKLGQLADPEGTWWEAGGALGSGVVAVVIIISAIDVWDAIQNHRKHETA